MRILRVLAPLVIAVAALSACAPTPQAQPAPAAAEQTPTSTPTPAATGPVEAFGGDCAHALPDASAVVGYEAVPVPATGPVGIRTLGGIGCTWYNAADEFQSVSLHALPVDDVPATMRGAFESVTCLQSYDWQQCHLGGTAAGTWVLVSAPALDEAGAAPDLAPALAAALASAGAWPDPRAATPSEDWWESVDCAQLETEADIAGAFAPHPFEAGYPSGFGDSPLTDVLAPTDQWCPWYSSDAGTRIWMNLLPGAGAQWDDAAFADGTPVEVAGAVAAVLVTEDGSEVLYATDGANVLRVREAPVPLPDLATRVFAALS